MQCQRRRTAAALMAIPRRFFPGQPESVRVSKMEPTRSTDAAGGRNRGEGDSPAAEKGNSTSGRKRGIFKINSTLRKTRQGE